MNERPPTPADADGEDLGALEGNLGQVTDEEWLAGHRNLMRLAGDVIPDDELAYLYEPGRDPATVSPAELTVTPDPAEPAGPLPGEVTR